MSIVVRFEPVSMTAEKYDGTIRGLEDSDLEFPPDGLDYHVCFGEEGNLLVSEIWSSREEFDAFGDDLMPFLQEQGIELAGPPKIFEVHNIIKP